jgi:hypothetical protein
MAHPFDAELRDLIRARTDARELVGARTDSPRVTVRCPHPDHLDRTPSCSVSASGYRCYGCGRSGDVFDLARLTLSIDHFPDVLRALARRARLDLPAERRRQRERRGRAVTPGDASSNEPTRPTPMPDRSPVALSARVYEHVVSALTLSGPGADYLERRGLDPHVCRLLGVRGVEGGQWQRVIEGAANAFGAGVVAELGLGRLDGDGRLAPHPRGQTPMLVFAYGLPHERVGLRFRLLSPGQGPRYLSLRARAGRLPSPYLADSRFRPTHGALSRDLLVVTEGELNALSLIHAGIPALGLPGAASWRDEWVMGFGGVSRVVVLLDGDAASRALRARVTAACARFWGEEWCATRLVFGHLRDPERGGVEDANDALVAGRLGLSRLLGKSRRESTPLRINALA